MFLFQRLDKTSGVTEQTDNRYNDRLLHLFLHILIYSDLEEACQFEALLEILLLFTLANP